jgi:phenylalanyl-tRNA synthetase beta subunit
MKEKKVKSVTFRIIFQSDKETLRKEWIEEKIDKILSCLKNR